MKDLLKVGDSVIVNESIVNDDKFATRWSSKMVGKKLTIKEILPRLSSGKGLYILSDDRMYLDEHFDIVVFISGAMTGIDNYQERFNKAEAFLKSKGCHVVNPAVMPPILETPDNRATLMRICLDKLSLCTHIFMLDNWVDSKGANEEKVKAQSMGQAVIYESECMVDDE